VEIKIASERYNPLLKRREVIFRVSHASATTPQRFELRKKLATLLNSNLDATLLIKVETKTGTNEAVGEAHIYDTPERAKAMAPTHWLRNLPPEEKAKLAEAKPAKTERKKPEKMTGKKPSEEEKGEEAKPGEAK